MRLSEELRERTKRYASGVIRLYVSLPKKRREVEVFGHQLLRSGTSVAAHSLGLWNKNMHYVYVLISERDHCFYTGCTSDLRERLAQHKAGRVPSTKERGSLKLIYYEASLSKTDAFRREKYLKTTYGKRYIRNRCKNYFTGWKASRARSNAEFCSKVDGLLQEADESHLWLELLRDDCGIETDTLLQEPESAEMAPRQTSELIGIFRSMVSKIRRTL